MAIAFDAATTIGPGNGDISATHTPVGTPRGVIVLVMANGGTDVVTGVTYGGTSMSEVSPSPLLNTAGDENGSVYCYFLGTSVPTGAQTVAVSTTGSVNKVATCFTVTASNDTEVVDTDTLASASQDDPSVTLVTGTGVETFIATGIHSGLATLVSVTVGADYTQVSTRDFGSQVAKTSRRTNIAGGGNITADWVTSSADDIALFGIAVRESAASTPDAEADISWIELEVPTPNAIAEVAWAEVEVPTPNAVAEIAWTELEVPTPNATADVAWAELEVPNAPAPDAQADIAWAELEVPTPNSMAEISWAEVEVPTPNAIAEISWAEFEVPTPNATADVAWAEFEVPSPDGMAQVAWAEFEVPSGDEGPGGRSPLVWHHVIRPR